jgi:hypothetical protein
MRYRLPGPSGVRASEVCLGTNELRRRLDFGASVSGWRGWARRFAPERRSRSMRRTRPACDGIATLARVACQTRWEMSLVSRLLHRLGPRTS